MTALTQRVQEGAYYTDGSGVWLVVNLCALGAVDLEDASGQPRSVGIDAFRRQFWLVRAARNREEEGNG